MSTRTFRHGAILWAAAIAALVVIGSPVWTFAQTNTAPTSGVSTEPPASERDSQPPPPEAREAWRTRLEAGADAFRIDDSDANKIVISKDQRRVVVYRQSNVPFKPYISELHTPDGIQLLLDAPADHLHHHGIMFAVAVNGVDFWAEEEKAGVQVDLTKAGAIASNTKDGGARVHQRLEWMPRPITIKHREGLLTEDRWIEVYARRTADQSSPTLVTWRSTLSLPEGVEQARISGSHYFGLGMRFVRGIDKTGKFINSDNADGEVVRGDEKLYPGRWCAYVATLDGKPVTVAMFNDPKNIRPATWFTMADPFAYLSATLKLHKEPLTLKAGQTLDLTYGVAAWDGAVERGQIEKSYALWLEMLPKGTATEPVPPEPKK